MPCGCWSRGPIPEHRDDEKRRIQGSRLFGEFAEEWQKTYEIGLKHKAARNKLKRIVQIICRPLHKLRLDEVETEHVIAVLRKVWHQREVSRDTRQRIKKILDAAIALNLRPKHNPADWDSRLKPIMPKQSKRGTIRGSHKAMYHHDRPAFMQKLATNSDQSARALEVAILTFARTIEVQNMRWSQLDLESGLWDLGTLDTKNERLKRTPLHGCTQSPDDFAAGTRMNFIAERRTCFVVYPAQPSEANQAKCWNWFRTEDQQRGTGEPSLIAGITRQIMRDYSVDPKRVYIGGLSAGAAAAAIMGATYHDLYAAIGIHSGLACGAAIDLPSAFVAMRQGGLATSSGFGDTIILTGGPTVPTIVFHGDRDMTVHPNNADHILEQFARTTSRQEMLYRGRVPGGHAYTRTVHADASGRGIFEHWNIHGAGHAWSGGSPAGSHTDPRGPDATKEMLRFFLEHSLPQ